MDARPSLHAALRSAPLVLVINPCEWGQGFDYSLGLPSETGQFDVVMHLSGYPDPGARVLLRADQGPGWILIVGSLHFGPFEDETAEAIAAYFGFTPIETNEP